MEILVLALGELLVAPLMLMVAVVCNIITAVFSVVLQLFFLPAEVSLEIAIEAAASRKPTETKTAEENVQKKQTVRTRNRKIAFWVGTVSVSILVLILLAGLIANAFFFSPTLRLALRYVKWKTDIAVDFEKAEGNLWTGQVRLEDVAVRRPQHPSCQFDLAAETIEFDLSIQSLFSRSIFKPRVFESLTISKLHGKWDQFPAQKLKTKKKKRRWFQIDHFKMDDVRLDYTDHAKPEKPLNIELRIDSLELKPLRSYLAVFDVLFHSNTLGSVNGVKYRFEKHDGETRWVCDDLPIDILASYFGRPFDWFESGKADILVVNKWKNDITMNWSFIFRNFHVNAPEGTSLKAKTATLPLVLFMNKYSERLPLEFNLSLNNDDAQFDSSPHWQEFAKIVVGEKLYDAISDYWKKFEKKKLEKNR